MGAPSSRCRTAVTLRAQSGTFLSAWATTLKVMAETSARLLSLLSLLQTPREWPGPELAQRLRRHDPDGPQRRRAAAPAGLPGGGHPRRRRRLPAVRRGRDAAAAARGRRGRRGRRQPAHGQRRGRRGPGGDGAARAHQAAAGAAAAAGPPGRRADSPTRCGSRADRAAGRRWTGQLLARIAAAARDREILRFRYSDHSGSATERRVEPYRLVNWGRHWYLVAFDLERDDWRTFRADRMSRARGRSGHRFALRPLPADDIAAYVAARTRQVQMKVQRPGHHARAGRGGRGADGLVDAGSIEPLGPRPLPGPAGRPLGRGHRLLAGRARRRLRGRRLTRAGRRRPPHRRPLRPRRPGASPER